MTQIISNNNGGGGGAGAYKYKGSVDYYEDLPTSGMKIGDTYNVVNPFTEGGKDYPAGTNVAWTGTEWDALGGSIDLSDYQKKLVEGNGIDIDQDTNEISVDTTVIATKQELNTKQDTISDLDTIRSNASAGKSAKDTIDGYGNIVTHNVSEFATSTQGTKADTALQPGDDISDLNNDSGFIDKDVNNLTNYTKTSDLPDFDTYQLKSNMVTSLNSADNYHYPTAKAVKDAITASGGGDVTGPSSSVDGHLAVFDGATGKIIKDGGEIPAPTTVVDNLTTQSATSALSANQGYVLDGKISTINGKIPTEASSSNKLADKQFVNDAINSVTAYYITKDAAGNQFATKAELTAATVFYSGGVVRVPTRNDYTIVLDDETHNDEVTRYIYNSGWEYQYTINESPLTQAQLDALNSGITSGKVSSYDSVVSTIAGYGNIVTHNTSEFATSTQGGKADTALQPNDNITELNNNAGYITGVDWGDIGGTLSDQVDLSNALGAKANNSDVVHTTGAETINGSKTFGTSPAVPSKSTDAGNNPTVIATEAQVAKKQDTLVSGTNIKTVNNNDLLGSGNLSLKEVPSTGNVGDVLTKTNDGYEFSAPQGSDYSWVTKTLGDSYASMQGPCDNGFHIPTNTEFTTLNTIGQTLGAWSSTGGNNLSAYLKMPYGGYRRYTDGTIRDNGSYGGYRTSIYNTSNQAYWFNIWSTGIDMYSGFVGQAYQIRPFKDTPVVPDETWTILYQGAGTAGIYHNSTLGLISISSDGTNWITISDKNCGATTVWNNLDTLSEANTGKYYQRGNNYGFPGIGSSETIATSATLVDVSSYGPGNYYNSSTFITATPRYTSANSNLRGGEGPNKGVEISLRTIVDTPSSDFLLTAPATLAEGEEYVIRIISEDNYTMTLGTGFTNPRNVDTSLSFYATDQFVFLAVGGVLELQPLVATGE